MELLQEPCPAPAVWELWHSLSSVRLSKWGGSEVLLMLPSVYNLVGIICSSPSLRPPFCLLNPLIPSKPERLCPLKYPFVMNLSHLLSIPLIFRIWRRWELYRMILHSTLKGCCAWFWWPFGSWLCSSCSALGTQTLLQAGQSEVASGLPSVPQNNPLLAGDEPSKIYKTPSQKPQLNFLIAILGKKKERQKSSEVASGFGVLTWIIDSMWSLLSY